MKVYLSPQISNSKSIIKINGEQIQVNKNLYNFSKMTDGKLISSNEDIMSAKRVDGELIVEIVNCLDESATEEELFPEWKPINTTDKLDEGLIHVELNWITQEELDVIENSPKPLTLKEQIAEKDAQILKLKEEQFKTQQMTTQNTEAQQELIELLMMMGVI